MNHNDWKDMPTIKSIECVHVDAKKFTVKHKLTPLKVYDVKNETEDFYFIVDNSGRIGGFYKYYFKEL